MAAGVLGEEVALRVSRQVPHSQVGLQGHAGIEHPSHQEASHHARMAEGRLVGIAQVEIYPCGATDLHLVLLVVLCPSGEGHKHAG